MISGIYLTFICVLLILCAYLCKKLYDFSIVILNLEEAIEESLDILDENYIAMNKILDTPVFFDSVEIRQVITQIKGCHGAILLIANKLTNVTGSIGEIKKEDSKE